MNNKLKVIITISVIVALGLSMNYYKKHSIAKESKKISKSCAELEFDGYKFGITKYEFDKIYKTSSKSYNSGQGYYDENDIVKLFHGLKVQSTQFIFSRDIFIGIGMNIRNLTIEQFEQLKSSYVNLDKWDKTEMTTADNKIYDLRYESDINECLYIKLSFSRNKNITINGYESNVAVFFGIEDNILYDLN